MSSSLRVSAPLLRVRVALCFAILASPAGAATEWILGPTFAEQTGAAILGAPSARRERGRWFTHFDGKGDGFVVPSNPLAGAGQFTIEILFRADPGGPAEQRFLQIEGEADNWITLETRLDAGQWSLDAYLKSATDRRTLLDRTRTHPAGSWHWAALRYDGQQMTSFVDGRRELTGPVEFAALGKGRSSVGVRLNQVYWFAGDIALIRFTDEALDPGELRR